MIDKDTIVASMASTVTSAVVPPPFSPALLASRHGAVGIDRKHTVSQVVRIVVGLIVATVVFVLSGYSDEQ